MSEKATKSEIDFSFNCPVCKKGMIKIKKAIYDLELGWICDCGDLTKGKDKNHVPLGKGFCEGYRWEYVEINPMDGLLGERNRW